jgi:OOP family OmpA-OmpF porin
MFQMKRLYLTVALAILATVFLASTALAEKLAPRVDNFILFVDYSGSMAMLHKEANKRKIVLVKELLASMTQAIPELGYRGGLYTFAPFDEEAAMAPYRKAAMPPAIDKIKGDYEIFNRRTPMGAGLLDIEPTLKKLSGKTAIIMFTDGDENQGIEPVAEAKLLASKYNVCFHVVSYADTPHGKEIIDQIRRINPCSCMNDIVGLTDRAKMDEFLRCALYTVQPEPVPVPAPAAKAESPDLVVLRNLNFDFDKSDIKDQFVPLLQQAAQILKDNPTLSIVCEGHTDGKGSVDYNQKLSERRASAVRDWLVNKGGLPASRIGTTGYGKTMPKFDNNTDEGRYLNRRVELRLTK